MFEAREVEYNGVVSTELVGMAKLIALPSEKVFHLNNKNKTEYRLATIEITTPSGATSQSTTQVFKRNLELMEERNDEFRIGTSYLTTLRAVQDEDGNPRIFATTSHLVASIMSAEVTNELSAMFGVAPKATQQQEVINTPTKEEIGG